MYVITYDPSKARPTPLLKVRATTQTRQTHFKTLTKQEHEGETKMMESTAGRISEGIRNSGVTEEGHTCEVIASRGIQQRAASPPILKPGFRAIL